MEFRRTSQRDERRRRVLMDEMRGGTEQNQAGGVPAGGRASGGAASRTYAEAALAVHQPAVTCLIPRRLWTLTVVFLSGLTIVAAIEALFVCVLPTVPGDLRPALTALDVTADGNLSQWFASFLLLLAAAYAALVFHLRRHKLDDYRGRYRVWIPAVVALLGGSLDAATGLHEAVARWLRDSTGTALLGDGTIWWLLTLGLGWLLLGGRLLLEMRGCRWAVMFLLTAASAYGVAIAVELELWAPGSWLLANLAQSTALLLGHFSIFFGVLAYCRHVYLAAQGELRPERTRGTGKAAGNKSSKSPAAPPKVTRRATLRVDLPHESPKKQGASKKAATRGGATAVEPVPENESDPDEETGASAAQRLSKAERRKLRKQSRQQRRS